MNMETQGIHSASNPSKSTLEDLERTLSNLQSITSDSDLMDVVRILLADIPAQDSLAGQEVIGVYVKLFTNMIKSMKGQDISRLQMEALFAGEAVNLELSNTWFIAVKPVVQPVLSDCRMSLMTAGALHDRGLTSQMENDTKKLLIQSAWGFIPWLIFLRTNSLKAYMTAKEIMTRMIVISPEYFGTD